METKNEEKKEPCDHEYNLFRVKGNVVAVCKKCLHKKVIELVVDKETTFR